MFISVLVFQLSGALLLLLNGMKSRKEEVIKNCFQGSDEIECDENNNCRIPKEKLQKSAHKIYMNIVAFVDLVIGYSFAVFSPNSDAKIKWILTKVFVFTFGLPILALFMQEENTKKIFSLWWIN